jgi:hypothetical protein
MKRLPTNLRHQAKTANRLLHACKTPPLISLLVPVRNLVLVLSGNPEVDTRASPGYAVYKTMYRSHKENPAE